MDEPTIGAAEFKAKCLRLLDELGPEGLIVTKHGRPVARVIPYDRTLGSSIGAMKGKIKVHGDILSTGITWNAEKGILT